ncbi:hypothetical protein AVEN_102663-1 [Araneus ventricosus]|uniref:Uncharacterized protein n=1 Tax=Araneus ventricosus TaxID=182803 RepID=A0A4Y2HYC5_ARAVE|nr:hypothetical protein AVEN_102663-1 [Araneus ventricosus]
MVEGRRPLMTYLEVISFRKQAKCAQIGPVVGVGVLTLWFSDHFKPIQNPRRHRIRHGRNDEPLPLPLSLGAGTHSLLLEDESTRSSDCTQDDATSDVGARRRRACVRPLPLATADRLPEAGPGLHEEVHYAGCPAPGPMSFPLLNELTPRQFPR